MGISRHVCGDKKLHARTLYTNGADKTLLGAFLHGSSAYCVKCTFMTDKHARACNERRSPTCIYTCKKKKQVVKEGCTLAGQRPDATTDAAAVAARRLLSFVRLRCDLFAYRRINGPFVFYLSLSRARILICKWTRRAIHLQLLLHQLLQLTTKVSMRHSVCIARAASQRSAFSELCCSSNLDLEGRCSVDLISRPGAQSSTYQCAGIMSFSIAGNEQGNNYYDN